ncbi:DlpA domain protein [Cordyceps militaris]|uniref:DlpA domain protein n=1 Tax=Cordyceps militaris TaxID=73501 RepID=A0A2H4S6X5_CORMI|nr:DlpA domain protein [Cordyceps militaris]
MSSAAVFAQAISELENYTACDISDALLKLKVPGAGFISDLTQYSPRNTSSGSIKEEKVTVAPVSTVLFTAKDEDPATTSSRPAPNFPKNTHWVDNAVPGTFAILQQAAGQTNAVCGGIMALRMKVLGVKGIIVAGRVRDLVELQSTELPIWALGTSTVGSGGSSTPWAREVPLTINGVLVTPGDLAFNDPVNGVVVIPQDKVAQVLELLPKLTSADDKAKADVALGVSVKEAFERHRG